MYPKQVRDDGRIIRAKNIKKNYIIMLNVGRHPAQRWVAYRVLRIDNTGDLFDNDAHIAFVVEPVRGGRAILTKSFRPDEFLSLSG